MKFGLKLEEKPSSVRMESKSEIEDWLKKYRFISSIYMATDHFTPHCACVRRVISGTAYTTGRGRLLGERAIYI